MTVEFETDKWPFVQAKSSRAVPDGKRHVRLIVIHSMEAPEKGDTAEEIAKFFQNPPKPASAHLCIDNNSIVQCVLDDHIAGGAPGANEDGIQLELAGYAKQTEAEWLDEYGLQLLDNAANAAAQFCLKFDIPVRRLTNEELVDLKSKGWDPGPAFPWTFFLDKVEQHRAARLAKITSAARATSLPPS